ncbi:UNVERIFIED_ORG: hypothetical protein J2Y93_004561 [Pantoea agglomerans]
MLDINRQQSATLLLLQKGQQLLPHLDQKHNPELTDAKHQIC